MTSELSSSPSAWLVQEGLSPEALPSLQAELERWEAQMLTPSEWNRRFLPKYFERFEPADFHEEFDRVLHNMHLTRGQKRSCIAPRGGAKSTWQTLAYPLRAALELWEPYTLILSDSKPQAVELLRHIRDEIESNPRLAEVYEGACGEGPEWKESRLRLRNGAVIEALGTGSKIRGRRNRSDRPSLIIFDDVQSNEDITSPTLRERAWTWASREVIPAGDERTNFLAVGSAIHREAVSVCLGNLAGWQGRVYPAIHSWPDRMDLWAEWERLATNLADPERLTAANAFYAAHRAEMDRSAVVYWPGRYGIADLMLRRAEIGHAAFLAEYQGVPGTLEGAEWPPEFFDWPGFWFDDMPKIEDTAMRLQSLDPSKGTGGKNTDYQAHVTLAIGHNGHFYFDCDMRREPNWCERALDIAARWIPHELVAESNNTMGLMMPEMLRLIGERPATTFRPTITEVQNTQPKLTRIRILTGYLQRRQIHVRNTAGGRMLVEQMRDVPNGSHDDGPDAMATAVARAHVLYGIQTEEAV